MYSTDFVTGKEIAMTLRISKALAYRLIARGDIPSIRFGRTVRVNREALDNFIKNKSSAQIETQLSTGSAKQLNTRQTKASPNK
ncbi:MAG: hypothetical protein MHPDNHAH_02822 [Anaerolineales bacterium]|nr:hypothetical protein [Anaerolineales bacterium]